MKTNKENISYIEEYYDIYSDGRVLSKRSGRFLKPSRSYNGSMNYMLTLDSGILCITVARLVAIKYVDNPLNKKYVIHKDGNVLNNKYDNLIWATNSEKFHQGYYDNHKVDKRVMTPELSSMLNNDARVRTVRVGGLVYESIEEACRELGMYRRKFNRLWNKLGVEILTDKQHERN
jgi:hypothetical protein